MSYADFVILNGVDKQCQNSTCFFRIGGGSVVDYLIGDSNSLLKSISNFSIGNKQPNLDLVLYSSKYVIV